MLERTELVRLVKKEPRWFFEICPVDNKRLVFDVVTQTNAQCRGDCGLEYPFHDNAITVFIDDCRVCESKQFIKRVNEHTGQCERCGTSYPRKENKLLPLLKPDTTYVIEKALDRAEAARKEREFQECDDDASKAFRFMQSPAA